MPRRQFVADLAKAVEGVAIAGISNVCTGDDDGEFKFMCMADGTKLEISVLVPELSDYPSSHTCMIFAPDDCPASVAGTFSDISDLAMGKTIMQLLELVSRKLESTDRDGDKQMLDSQEYDDDEDDEFGEEDEDEVDEYFPDDDILPKAIVALTEVNTTEAYTQPTSIFRNRIRSDLITARAHGFKIGHLGGLMDGLGCYISVSCRMSKLGISTEAMQAWQVEPSEYLIALFHYPSGYKSMCALKTYDAVNARRHFNVRVGVSTSYKPTLQEAVRAFTTLSKDEEKRREDSQAESQSNGVAHGFRNSFISRPLNELLEERFTTLLNYRYNGMSWGGAEEFYNDNIGSKIAHSELGLHEKYLQHEQVSRTFPELVTADHIQDSLEPTHSLPLVGMQFVLRHFVRCTEFCLICFTKMSDDLQAIKPYVCDKPLCLYQYMSLGFGPSIEHEILSQPKVVDLLVSFCYNSARLGNLKDFPSGLSLMVPPSSAYEHDYVNTQHQSYSWGMGPTQQPPGGTPVVIQAAPSVRFNPATREMLFEKKEDKCPFRVGEWVIIRSPDNRLPLHCRVVETALYPTVRVAEPVTATFDSDNTGDTYSTARVTGTIGNPKQLAQVQKPINEFRPATYRIYNQNFDEMDDFYKREAIYALLDVLPCIEDMRKYLVRKAQSDLSSWVDRLPPALLGILRWIIASNRACIVQVGEADDTRTSRKGEERLYGMSGWSQFRFAMGAPDKERRFLQALRETSERLNLKYPTLFAWHGSPLQNWHSIIREGLHFKDTAHGRAYGHGVYHSLEMATSIGYSGGYGGSHYCWPQSELKISQALALNEIVNAPKDYVSMSPHLVVAQLDWIQTRYLFVKTSTTSTASYTTAGAARETKPVEYIEQDPSMTPRGATDRLIIPVHAVSGSRRPRSRSVKITSKRMKMTLGTSMSNPIDLDADDDDDGASVATLEEDRNILLEEEVYAPQAETSSLPTPNSIKGKSKASNFLSKIAGSKPSKSLTDYVPGTLDYASLPMLEEPAWATGGATTRLMKDFQQLLKVQAKEPPHELGWHIDADKIENMYQWIVELHSFDATLPLAKDMKTKGHKSIVLELRFGRDYPMSPPFVRVIRPRFLGFQQGGGGHVTAGGAMCMQLLTNDGWSAVSSIESVLLQVRMAMSSLEPKPARLEGSSRTDYGVGEAIDAYIRACQVHGWRVPDGFREMALGGIPGAAGFY